MSDRRKAGDRVTEHIRLVRELGHGAMGAVWVADHLTLETQVAVKFINRKLLADEGGDLRQRFSREARSAAQIKSPHVVQIFDHGVMEDGTPYIVMELLEGESLADRLERTGWLSLKQCVQVVAHTASALTKAHKLGIVHRDIKPENIFLCPSDDGLFVKLLDFGIAKHGGLPVRSTLTAPGLMIGTAEYMSREQVISAAEVDHQADLWALGVVAYEVLTGDVPFTGETIGAICAAIVRGRYAPASALRKECPFSADDFFEKAFRIRPGDRYPTARDMASAYRDAIDDEISLRLSEPTPINLPRGTSTDVGLGESRQASTIDDTAARAIVRNVILPTPAGAKLELQESLGPVETLDDPNDSDELPPPARRRLTWVAAVMGAVGVGAIAALLMASSAPPKTMPVSSAVVPAPISSAASSEAPPVETAPDHRKVAVPASEPVPTSDTATDTKPNTATTAEKIQPHVDTQGEQGAGRTDYGF